MDTILSRKAVIFKKYYIIMKHFVVFILWRVLCKFKLSFEFNRGGWVFFFQTSNHSVLPIIYYSPQEDAFTDNQYCETCVMTLFL